MRGNGKQTSISMLRYTVPCCAGLIGITIIFCIVAIKERQGGLEGCEDFVIYFMIDIVSMISEMSYKEGEEGRRKGREGNSKRMRRGWRNCRIGERG